MSNVSAAPAEFDFWEFVSCSRCQLPFASGSGATVPFWLTECGHVVCNTHLNMDQSCAQCGMANIQLVPLQLEMEAPMSEWFRSIPHALDTVAYAAKFQQETMAFQIRYFKARQQQQRALIDKLKHETAELKKLNEILAHENAQFRQHLGYRDGVDGELEPSDDLNHNGKRPMNDADPYRPKTSSSRSAATPLGPNRLTLPPGHQPPSLSSNRVEDPEPRLHPHTRLPPPPQAASNNHRPGSSRFLEQYSYIPPSTQQYHTQALSHSQTAPRRAKQNQNEQPSQALPRGSTRFKPAQGTAAPSNQEHGVGRLVQKVQNQPTHHDSRLRNMGPPPTPQQVRLPTEAPPLSTRRNNTSMHSNGRSLPPSQRFVPPAPVNQQRFMPSTSSGVPQHFSGDSRGPVVSGASRAVMNARPGGGQRVPFVPHASGGFG
ncbi:RING-type domain-containing protein [Favolaschia claudopus]|uniref:RING-type domain-containing protein n=1 Tax=Favolaschia claudopus TaxID=2862362 RepID=A0AAW0B553_9AGAR